MIQHFLITALTGMSAVSLHASIVERTDTLREVTVTAIKQAESLNLQPVAATTIGEQAIDRYNITSMKDASELVPNFFMPDYGSRMTSSIYVRGLGSRMEQPAVGLNVDNIPVAEAVKLNDANKKPIIKIPEIFNIDDSDRVAINVSIYPDIMKSYAPERIPHK